MNGIHDMGGMQDMGPIQYEKGEPVFHAQWESRVFAMFIAAGAWRKWNLDAFRHTREVLPPADYLRVSYYEQWFSGLLELLVRRGLVTAAEIESGVPAPGAARATPPLTADKIPAALANRIHANRDVQVSPHSERSIETTAFSFFRIPTRIFSARSRSMFTPCASPRASCGASKLRPAIPFFSICGMTTLNQPDPIRDPANLAAVPELPRDAGGPVFAEPWQAQAFALAVKLSEQGHFTWKEWATALAGELSAAADRGEPDDGSRYYHHWLAALERLVVSKRLSDPAALLARKEAWADAYRHTPHGKPVELSANSRGPQRE